MERGGNEGNRKEMRGIGKKAGGKGDEVEKRGDRREVERKSQK